MNDSTRLSSYVAEESGNPGSGTAAVKTAQAVVFRRFVKAVMGCCAIGGIAAALSFVSPSAAKASAVSEYGVKLQVNDSIMAFQEAGPLLSPSGTLLVPARAVAEKLGYQVDFSVEGAAVSLKLNDGKTEVALKTGSTDAVVNGKPLKLETAPLFSGGSTFVPLRALSQSFGFIVQWDDANGVAIIAQDGIYHAPAWYAPPKKTLGQLVLETAQTYTGVRYQWGGTTPAGFDCSGYVNYVFDQYGIDLPRTSRSMYDTAGTGTVGLLPGDLVFFNIGSVTTHVGIYMGDGQFISSTTSRGVRVDTLMGGYWGARFIGAKRVL